MVAIKKKKKSSTVAKRRFFGQLISNFISTRAKIAESMRSGYGIDPPGRDLDYECGYPDIPDIYTFRRLYEREGYAKRVVDVWPDECWSVRPELYETEDARITKFERAWKRLNKRVNVWHHLHRLDRISGIGCFGVLLLGLDDGKSLDQPVAGINRRGEVSTKNRKKSPNLIYLRPFSEECVEISEKEMDRSNPRYGQPRYYQIRVSSPDTANTKSDEDDSIRVHWTRIIHVADNTESSPIYGTPRMQPVLNRLLDIRKTLGGSAEMFWKGAFPGYSFETHPDMLGEAVMNEDTIRDQFEEYMEGLKRYLALDGATVKQLFPQVADPSKHVAEQVTAICATLAMPLRIFLGSEAGHLASTQDLGTWNRRVAQRQTLFIEPMIIRPFIDRLIMIGVLPEVEDYIISWRDMNTMSDKDKAEVSLKRAQAMMQYVTGNVEAIMPLRQFFTLVLGLTEMETDAIMTAIESNDDITKAGERLKQEATPKPAPQGGGRVGNPAKRSGGRPRGNIQKNRLHRRAA